MEVVEPKQRTDIMDPLLSQRSRYSLEDILKRCYPVLVDDHKFRTGT